MSKKDNVDKIKSYIDDILGTKSSLKDKLLNAKLYVEKNFSERLISNQTLKIYNEILSEKKFKSYLLDRDQKLNSDWISQ